MWLIKAVDKNKKTRDHEIKSIAKYDGRRLHGSLTLLISSCLLRSSFACFCLFSFCVTLYISMFQSCFGLIALLHVGGGGRDREVGLQ